MDEPISETILPDTSRDAERLQTLYVVNDMLKQVVAEGLDINVILPRVLRVALEELNAFSGSIIVINEKFEPQHAWLITGNELEENTSPFLKKVVEQGLFAWATETQQTGVVNDTRHDERWLPRPDHPTAREPWSAVCAPLIIRARPVGAITMTKPGASQFDARAVNLLNAIANQAATTIESARLYKESQQRANELAALVSATAAVSSSLKLEEVLQGVAEEMAELVEVDTCAIFDWDTSNDLLKQRLLYAPQANPHLHEELQLRESFDPAEYPLTRQVLTSNKPVQVQPEDLNGDNSPSPLLEQAQIQSALLLPMVMHDQPIGLVMLMDTKQVRFFSQQEIDFAQMLANQTAFAVQNARLYEEAQRQLKVSALLNEASKVINSTLDTNEILQSILAQMNELLNAEAISIALVDKQRNELVYEVAEGIGSDKILGLRLPSNQGVSGWVMEHGRPALVQDTRNDPRFYRQADKRTGHDTTAMVCAPLQVKGEVLGTIQAINPKQGTFTENDLQLMVNLANLAGSALANAQQFARTQAAEARYLSLFADSVNPIVLTDPAGIIVEANRRAFDFFGYERDELIGLLIQHLHVSGELKDRLPRLSTIGYERAETFGGEICTKGQQTIPIEGYVKRTRSGDSELLQWMYRDISQQVELEQMREDLMAMLIHDLQAPLGNIISSLELMRYELTSAPDTMLASIVDIAARSGRRLQTLIRSLLDINHLEAGHPVTDVSFVDINALIAEARELILPTLERRQVELVIDVPPDLSDLFVDRDMVSRIFVNLLDNASKYTPERKQVTVKVRPAEDEELVKVELSDQGPGIPPQFRDAIFEKFRRLQGKNMPKGMGLGLAFCRLAVEAHGGSIWVDDAPGGGARFNFTLPTTEAALQQTRSD